MDSDCVGLCGNVGFGLAGHEVTVTLRKVAFSSHKAALATKKRPIVASVTLTDPSAFVPSIVVVVQV